MKVLFLTNVPSPYRSDFFNELGKYCDLTVTFEGEKATDRDDKWVGEKSEFYKPIFLKGKRTNSDQFFCPDIIKVIKQHFDQIIVTNYSSVTSMLAIEYMKLHKIQFWIEADGGLVPKTEKHYKYCFKKHFIGAAHSWLSSGSITSDYFEHYGADKKRIYIYPFSSLRERDILKTPISKVDKQNIRLELGILENNRGKKAYEGKIFLSVGQFIYRKGFDVLLKAWSDDKNSRLYIVGSEPTSEYLQLIKELKIRNVYFIGFKTKDELKKYYKASDVFVLPTREDIWGLVINEAMSNGLPVISTNRCVAAMELVKPGITGEIVPSDNVEQLSKSINKAITFCYDQQKVIDTIRPYTIENMAKAHYQLMVQH